LQAYGNPLYTNVICIDSCQIGWERDQVAEILIEKLRTNSGKAWIRTHATTPEMFAICTSTIYSDLEDIELGSGHITCPDCVETIRKCMTIVESDLAPEYKNEFLNRQRHRED
jgi:hypothetical protein